MTKSRSNIITLLLALVGCGIALLLTVEHYTKIDIGCTKTGEGCATTLNSDYGHIGPIPTSLLGLGMYLAFAGLCLVRGKQLKTVRDREVEQATAYAKAVRDRELEESGVNVEFSQKISAADSADSVDSYEVSDLEALARKQTANVPPTLTALPPISSGIVKTLDATLWGLASLGFVISLWLQYIAIYQLHSFCKYCFTSAILVTLIFALTSWDYLVDGRKLTGEQKMLLAVSGFIVFLVSWIVVPDIWALIIQKPNIVSTPTTVKTRDIVTNQLLHVKGDAISKYMLIEFADYMCGHCAKASPIMEDVLKRYPNTVRIAFRNFPLPIPQHKWSRFAALAAEAAGEQGKFWEMHDLLFAHQNDMQTPDFQESSFDKWADELKLDVPKFQVARQSDELKKRVMKDTSDGQVANILSTPTFFFVTPKFVVKFAGVDELNKYMADAKKWDTPPPPSKDANTSD